jgi:4-amino-4-deoxy-L-arabinose transferase-like glycosyltransferase
VRDVVLRRCDVAGGRALAICHLPGRDRLPVTLGQASRDGKAAEPRRRTERFRRRYSRAALGILLFLPGATAGVRIFRGGLPALAYDECEYAMQMLETAEMLFQRGLLLWPEIVAQYQPYVKPPLLVDIAAGVLFFVGRSHAVHAIAVTMIGITALTSVAVYRLVRDLFSASTAVLAVLALGAVPAGGLFASKFFPEPLVTLLLVLLLAVLFTPSARESRRRTLLLAAVVAAGLLAKSTFPVLAAGPLLVRLWVARSDGQTVGWILRGTALGVAVSALWYAGNFGDAFGYVRDAYDWASWTPASFGVLVRRWIRVVGLQALGMAGSVSTLAVAVLAALAFAKGRIGGTGGDGGPRNGATGPWASLAREQRAFLLALAAASVPSIAVALPSPNVSTRLLLPAFSVLAMGALIGLAEARLRPAARALRGAVLSLVAIQWVAVQIGGLSPVGAWAAPPPVSAVLRALNWHFGPLDRFDTRPLEALLRATAPLAWSARALGPKRPTLYFVDNYPELDLARFQLYQSVRQARLPLRWVCYFEWSEDRRATALEDAREGQSLIVTYRPHGRQRSDLAFLNRHGEACLHDLQDPASGFHKVRDLAPPGAGYALELYANFDVP